MAIKSKLGNTSFTKYSDVEKEQMSPIKAKLHKRNYSSIINSRRIMSVNEGDTQDKSLNSRNYDDFQVRRPLGRKDYFVFGMNDRNNP